MLSSIAGPKQRMLAYPAATRCYKLSKEVAAERQLVEKDGHSGKDLDSPGADQCLPAPCLILPRAPSKCKQTGSFRIHLYSPWLSSSWPPTPAGPAKSCRLSPTPFVSVPVRPSSSSSGYAEVAQVLARVSRHGQWDCQPLAKAGEYH